MAMVNVVRRKADWTDIRLFWAVARLGSFGAAARTLDMGLTTITRAVDRLEERLNTKLLIRGPQGVTLTEAGERAYDSALTMERAAESFEHQVSNSENTVEGRVRLAAPDGLAGVFLPPHMPEFLRANPRIDLVIDCGLWPDRPMLGEIDMSLTFTEPKNPDMVAIPLAYFHYTLFASREYLELYRKPTTAEEVASHPYVHHAAQDHNRETWHPRTAAFQDFLRKRIVTNSSAVSFFAIRQGAGIGPLPTAILALDPNLVMLDLPVETMRLWLVRHRDAGRSARVRAVIDWLREVFDAKRQPWYRAEFVHPREFGPYLDPERVGENGAVASLPIGSRRRKSAS
ncbi:MAG: LysR family transcriptional regulator [Caulobacteraceae bacterium]|nr:LysR family transcriptional regulator [Caulobacteraceae bacterium]